MYHNVLSETRKIVDSLNHVEDPTIKSLKIIKRELEKIRLYQDNKWIRQIKSDEEYIFYQKIQTGKISHPLFPKILDLKSGEVILEKYDTEIQLTDDVIVKILDFIGYLKSLGYVHRSLNPSHILKGPKIIDYGKLTKIGNISEIYSVQPRFMSRNTLMQKPAQTLDDLESLGYMILNDESLSSFESKTSFKYPVNNSKMYKYFKLVHSNIEDVEKYIKIFNYKHDYVFN